MLNALAPNLPGLIGGSADLAPSNMTLMKVGAPWRRLTSHASCCRCLAYCPCMQPAHPPLSPSLPPPIYPQMFGDFQKNSYAERNMRFGVREHAMGAIANGEQCCAGCEAGSAGGVVAVQGVVAVHLLAILPHACCGPRLYCHAPSCRLTFPRRSPPHLPGRHFSALPWLCALLRHLLHLLRLHAQPHAHGGPV